MTMLNHVITKNASHQDNEQLLDLRGKDAVTALLRTATLMTRAY